MKKKMLPSIHMPILCFGVFVLCASTLRADNASSGFSDRFDLNVNDRKAGMSLDGLAVENGSGKWTVHQGTAVITEKGTVSVQKWWDHSQASVPASMSASDAILSADIRPFTCDWIAVAFLAKAGSLDWFSDDNQLWVYLKSNGFVQLWQGKKAMVTVYGPPAFDPSVYHALSMVFNAVSNSVAVSLDGVEIIKPLDLGGFHPRVEAAGFRINRNPNGQQAGAPQIDNFKCEFTQNK
ncbi:MAG: hypothetical protein ACFUZC_04150 [Chthoniobacteraceae bacterium]